MNEQERALAGSGTLNKSVIALAFTPLTMSLTLTGRKILNVLLYLAQQNPADEEGGWSYPVPGIMGRFNSRTKATERTQRYIEQMVQTSVIFRPLSQSDEVPQFELVSPSPRGQQHDEDQVRTFTLLSEARLFRRGREWWVQWFFPPTIRDHLLRPERWAQLELRSIAAMSTYTALALYEIVARYKDSPGKMTSRQPPQFWIDVLREGCDLKPREYRKFKSEALMPAIAEINERTEVSIELIEHRTRGTVDAVQFRVAKKSASERSKPEAVDMTMVTLADEIGIKEVDMDDLVSRFGEPQVFEAMSKLRDYVNRERVPIINRLKYLTKVLQNMRGSIDSAQTSMFEDASPPALSPAEIAFRPTTIVDGITREEMASAWRINRMRDLRQEFASFPRVQREAMLEELRPAIMKSVAMTPNMIRRLDAGEWESPLIMDLVIRAYAARKFGPAWDKPSEFDLVIDHRD